MIRGIPRAPITVAAANIPPMKAPMIPSVHVSDPVSSSPGTSVRVGARRRRSRSGVAATSP